MTLSAIVLLLRRRAAAHAIALLGGLVAIYVARVVAVAIAHAHHAPRHYSTHAAFATVVVIALWFLAPRWRALLAAVWLAYMVLIVYVGYHTIGDVVIGDAVAAVVALPWFVIRRANDRVTDIRAD